MKRLFRIGAGLFVFAIIPIAMWLLLSLIYNEPRIASVFTMTYLILFIMLFLKYIFGSGANIRQAKENDLDAVQNGLFWGVIFATIVFGALLMLVDSFIEFMGQDVEFYRIWVIFWILFIYLKTLLYYIIEKLYYEDKERIANIHLITVNSLALVLMCVLSLVFQSPIVAIVSTLSVMAMYIIVLYIRNVKRFKIKFNFLKSAKYESGAIASAVISIIIYLFGIKVAFVAGEEYIMALSIIAMATDAQWDMMKAIDTATKVDITKGRFEYTKRMKDAHIYTCFVVFLVLIAIGIMCLCYKVNYTILLIYLSFHLVDFFLTPSIEVLSAYTQVEYSSTLNAIIYTTTRGFRALLSVLLLTPYSTVIAQLTQSALLIITFFIVRKLKYEVKDGKLLIKQPKNKNA